MTRPPSQEVTSVFVKAGGLSLFSSRSPHSVLARVRVNTECFLSDVGSVSRVQIPVSWWRPLTARGRTYSIVRVGGGEVPGTVACLLNPVIRPSSVKRPGALGSMWLGEVETARHETAICPEPRTGTAGRKPRSAGPSREQVRNLRALCESQN